MEMFLLPIVAIGLVIWVILRSTRRAKWFHMGTGERAARAEFARIKREQPTLKDAQLSEAEFVDKFVKAGPGSYRAS